MRCTWKISKIVNVNGEDANLTAEIKDSCSPGPSCSKLTSSLVNDSLKFTSSDTQIC